MPQDSLRSVVYRSLVTCEDPNGVVEYETMRKSKNGSRKKEQKIERVETLKDSIRTSVYKELKSEGIKEESLVQPPFQILEVSRGAQKLNLMIDSWSKGLSFDGQSKDIARDLLKGALDLQESLVMLCELQEASKYLGQIKKEHTHKYGGIDDVAVERNDLELLVEKDNHSEIQRGRLSLDGSSRSSIEELKKVIRDSLSRQNLLSIPSNEGKDFSFRSRKLDDFSDIPSTSSSQSSMVHSNNSTSVDWSASSTSKEAKAKSRSVIAKLMGLEDFPLEEKSLKQTESKKNVNHRKLSIDIEMPNARKAYILSRNEDPARKTLKEVIETMHLKGLLKGNDVEGLELPRHNSSHLPSKQRIDDEMPPIVLIKPLGFPCKEEEDSVLRNASQEEGSFYNFRKLGSKEESYKRFYQGEGELGPKEEPLRTMLHNEEVLNLNEISDKLQTKATPIKRAIREERASNSKEMGRRREMKEPKTREKASANKVKLTSVPLNYKPQEKGANNEKIEREKKVLPNRKMPVEKEKEKVKSVPMSRSRDQVRATSTKSRKPESGPIITKNRTQRQESTNPTSSRSIQSKARSAIGQAKNNVSGKAKSVNESMPTSSVIKKLQCKHSDKEINQTNKMECVSKMTSSGLEDQVPATDEMESYRIQIEDQGEEQKSNSCEVPTENNQHGSNIESAEELKQVVEQKFETEETTKHEFNLKELLSSSPSFLSCAENLFELDMNEHTILQTNFREDVNMIDTRLFLDCANELMECKSYQISLVSHPVFWTHMVNPRTNISLEKLIGEVCDGFQKLRNYIKVYDDIKPTDSIHNMLENDIKWKRPFAGVAWDLGWEFGFSAIEADQVLGELEKQVLNELIEEIIVDYPDIMAQHLYSW